MEMWPQTKNEALPLIREAISLFKTFRPDAAEWLLPFVLKSEGVGDWNTYLAIARQGERVPDEEKLEYGLAKWFVICRPCWDHLTDKGRRAPREAVEDLLRHVAIKQGLAYRRWQIADLLKSTMIKGRSIYEAITIRADESCCAAARRASQQLFAIDDYPDLPLPECDQVWCGCDWRALTSKAIQKR